MIKRPSITPQAAFEQLRANQFEPVQTKTCDLAIEPGQDPVIENMIAFVDGDDPDGFCNMFAVHEHGHRWTVVG